MIVHECGCVQMPTDECSCLHKSTFCGKGNSSCISQPPKHMQEHTITVSKITSGKSGKLRYSGKWPEIVKRLILDNFGWSQEKGRKIVLRLFSGISGGPLEDCQKEPSRRVKLSKRLSPDCQKNNLETIWRQIMRARPSAATKKGRRPSAAAPFWPS